MAEFVDQFTRVVDQLSRSGGGRVEFADQPMPEGANPVRASVTVIVDKASKFVALKVRPRVHCDSAGEEVRQWLHHTECRFPNSAVACSWVTANLLTLYAQPASSVGHGVSGQAYSNDSLTDVDAVEALRSRTEDQVIHLKAEDVTRELGREVFGQDHVLPSLAERIVRHLARRSPRRPCTLWFAGTTGVGKTKSAEVLPKVIKCLMPEGRGYATTRLDMSEYGEAHRRSQLLGAPQGYVGHGEGAQLTDALAANPRHIVLFDEIEKAHPTVLQTLMNAMDAGRLSTSARNASGTREINCCQSVFIFTSNLENESLVDEATRQDAFDDPAQIDQLCRRGLHSAGIAPELIGRIGAFLLFKPLSERAMAHVVALAVRNLGEEYGVRIEYIDPAVVAAILDQTSSHCFGARPYEYAADSLLGGIFAEAATRDTRMPFRIIAGDPPRCIPVNNCAGLLSEGDGKEGIA
ncbi:AAA family ATPase [Bythopirellula polymerisocia]|uniref:Chaperone protein ClpB 1 n=1 Tax=Bythopirellula polymerisocia TaxID=2528003 RepID=A0A5C6CAR3_9BACT|nr:AAA family ATPase [Bythopirellula polymerisocia]TWU21308.1 Chaperone protein ClpB 1 [Bythopirellula polymerisocia]